MKDFIFISDFDGTITKKDFYWIVIDDYIGEKGKNHYVNWKKNNKIDIEFLNKVFSWHEFDDEEVKEALGKIEIDPYLRELYDFIIEHKGDFLILSAGFNYYINESLKREGLDQLNVITNKGNLEKKIFVIKPDKDAVHYSSVYGVDKEKVVIENKKAYKKVFYAGDSEPDFKAALAADVVFAKGELRNLLEDAGSPFYAFESFSEVINILVENLHDF